ncbi:aldose 1-epimerase [Thermasporomyces composti]|jgi:galactose mutarotase-like enzyme|uniref:Galactose mutarotase-like enzyme n=1 Tax=Thermasporomyces composti TaxID=696763 RepID=A0A3D9V154_THECX|nr:aldose 1-epimerase [Thermasporomyces composti]REF35136.1 galactose mutarotase-like enzyme [Thermasporomyces composti]
MTVRRDVVVHRGWEVVRLCTPDLSVDVVPGKGGDITSVRWRPDDVELMWQSPWGLRHRGAPFIPGDSEATLMDWYPGGWQTVFPNAGPAVEEHGVTWGMHGEAWLAPYDWEPTADDEVLLRTRLVRSPFEIERRIRVRDAALTVTETVRNVGGTPVEVAWGHHIAFGQPFLDGDCRLEVPTPNPPTFVVDDERDRPASDLPPGATFPWPKARDRSGVDVDLRVVPGPDRPVDRLGYLVGLTAGRVELTNQRRRLRARLDWDVTVMPYTWLWYEMHATETFPWYRAVYVLGIEPHSSYPGQGLHAIREKTGTQLRFEPGEERTATTTLTVTRV